MLQPYVLSSSTSSFVQNSQTSSMVVLSSSFASTASFAPNYLLISSTGSMLQPYLLNNTTSSMLAPYMLISSASLFVGTGSFNNFTASINNVTGSFATTGSNIFIGNQTITGSINISGSSTFRGNQIITGSIQHFYNNVTNYQTIQRSNSLIGLMGHSGNYFINYDTNGRVKIGGGTGNLLSSSFVVFGNAAIGSAYEGVIAPTDGLVVAGNSGFGTSNPQYRLDVSGSGNFTNNLTVTGSTILQNGQTTIQGNSSTTGNALVVNNSTPISLYTIQNNGQQLINSPIMVLSSSGSAFVISQSISHSAIVGAQVYGINYQPVFYGTTGSQTETAFKINAVFTASSAVATGGTNIITDFGSTNSGTQFSVTDTISGSIYMVNDVSGLPIIEATSDWGVKIWDFPRVVLEKTGSIVKITGSLQITGSLIMSPTSSFVLPLTASNAPQTGSAYWSGSFLFVWNGTRYMSSSFA